jgi:hypothetical protein
MAMRISPTGRRSVLGAAPSALAAPALAQSGGGTAPPATLRDLLDRAAVIDTVNRVAMSADLRDWDAVRACMADTVLVDYTSLVGGTPAEVPADQLIDGWRATLPGFDATQHLLGNHQVTLRGDEADCLAHFQAQHRIGTGAQARIWELDGTYRHSLLRQPAGWRIRAVTMRWTFERGERALLAEATARAARR